MALTPSQEVAVFLDDNQFGSGQSEDKCGPEAVSVVFHSVAPGQKNPYSSADVHAMASADYIKFIGPDSSSDQAGTSNQTLYNMLASHDLAYKAIAEDKALIKQWLQAGYPVILGIVESSVVDMAVGAPYNWSTAGLTHVIVASGAGTNPDHVFVRDTANIASNGVVRPGPRDYNFAALQLVSATVVIPSWMPVVGSPPTAPTPAPVPLAASSVWYSGFNVDKEIPFVTGHGIPDSYARLLAAGRYIGYPISQEFDSGGSTMQLFSAGQAIWNKASGQTTWSTPAGTISG